MKPLRSSDLTERIAIRRPVKADNGKGGYTTTWSTVAEPWARVIGLDGRESVMEHVLQGVSVYQIRIWYREGIQASDQVTLGARNLNIRSCADPFGTRRELLLVADTASARKAA